MSVLCLERETPLEEREREIWQRREGGCDRKGRWTGGRGLAGDQKERKQRFGPFSIKF